MNREVEERIVAMYFDNQDFEKHAKQTIQTLSELKNGLDMKEAAKGFETLDKAGKGLNLSRVTESVRNLKNQLTGMGGSIGKALEIGNGPIRGLENFFGTFQSYVTKFIGFDLASKLVGSLESALRQLTIAPIEQGFQQYQQNMDSVKTIMSGTMQSYSKAMKEANKDWTYDEAEHLDFVKEKLADLTEYANQTIYSLSDMTSNIGKFTNNNVKLEESVTAMKGIANATAAAGQGAQQASMAMYNISQAIGVGHMLTMDWKSLENANIATSQLKDTFIKMAAAAGQLDVKEVEENGQKILKYYTKMDENARKRYKKMTKAQKKQYDEEREVNAERFRETLKDKWLDKETMLRTFAVYSGDMTDMNTLMSWGFSEDEANELIKIGQAAQKAATEVRTFSKMWDALKESVQTGWAQSMELIFGDVKEATKLWTDLNNIFSEILDGQSANRRKVLLEWRGLEEGEDGTLKRIKGERDGREDLITGMKQVIYLARDLGKTVSWAWENVFGKLDGKKLKDITEGFKNLTFRVRNWLGNAGQMGDTRLKKLQKGLEGLFSILKATINIVKVGWDLVKRLVSPVADILLNLFSKTFGFFQGLGEMNLSQVFQKLGEGLSKLWEKIKSFFKPTELIGGDGTKYQEAPIVTFMKDTWEHVKKSVREWATDNGLDGIVTFFENLGDKIQAGWNAFIGFTTPIWEAVGSFLGDTWNWISTTFGITRTVESGYKDGKLQSWYNEPPIMTFLNDIWETIKSTWNTIVEAGRPVFESIGNFLSNTWDWISTTFGITRTVESGYMDGRLQSWYKEPPVVTFLSSIWETIRNTWDTIVEAGRPVFESIGNFLSNTWDWISTTFGIKQITESGYRDGKLQSWYKEPPVVIFLSGVWEAIQDTWNTIVETGRPVFESIGNFLSNTWDWIATTFGITPVVESGYVNGGLQSWYREPPAVTFLNGVWEALQNTWNAIVEAGRPVFEAIGAFLGDTWNWLVEAGYAVGDFFGKTYETGKTGFITAVESVWETLQNVWSTITETGRPIFEAIAGFLGDSWNWIVTTFGRSGEVESGYRDGKLQSWYKKSQAETFLVDIWESIKNTWNNVSKWEGWKAISQFLSDTWSWITSMFSAGDQAAEEFVQTATSGSGVTAASTEEVEEKTSFLKKVIDVLKELFDSAAAAVSQIVGIPEIEKFFNGMGELLKGIASILSTVMNDVGKILQGKLDEVPAVDYIVAAIGLIGTIVLKIVEFKKIKNLAKAGGTGALQSIGLQFLEIAGGLLLIATAVSMLTAIDQNKMWQAVVAIGLLGLVLGAVIAALRKLNDSGRKDEPITAWERIGTQLIKYLGMNGMLYILMSNLPAIIDKFTNAKVDGEGFLKFAEGLVIIVGGIALIGTAVTKLGVGKIGIGESVAALGHVLVWLVGLGAAIGGIGAVMSAIVGEENEEAVIEAIEYGGRLLRGIGKAIGNFFAGIGTAFGLFKTDEEKTKDAGKALELLNEYGERFNLEQVSGISRMIALMADLSETAKDLDSNKIANFGEAMKNLGLGLAQFNHWTDFLEKEDNGEIYDRMHNGADLIGHFVTALRPLMDEDASLAYMLDRVNKLALGDNGKVLETFVQNLQTIIDALGGLRTGENVSFDGLKIVTNMYSAIQDALMDESELPKFDGTKVIDALTAAILVGKKSIALAIHNTIQEGINTSGTAEGGGEYTLPEGAQGGIELFNNILQNGLLSETTNSQDLANKFMGFDMNSLIGGVTGNFTELGTTLSENIPDLTEIMQGKGWFGGGEEGENAQGDMLTQMQSYISQIQESMQGLEGIEFKVTPVIDMDAWKNEKTKFAMENGMSPVLFGGRVNMPSANVNLDGSETLAELKLLNSQVSQLLSALGSGNTRNVNAIDSLGGKIHAVGDAITHMKLILDSGQLVGDIVPLVDQKLYERAVLSGRTGVATTTAPVYVYE